MFVRLSGCREKPSWPQTEKDLLSFDFRVVPSPKFPGGIILALNRSTNGWFFHSFSMLQENWCEVSWLNCSSSLSLSRFQNLSGTSYGLFLDHKDELIKFLQIFEGLCAVNSLNFPSFLPSSWAEIWSDSKTLIFLSLPLTFFKGLFIKFSSNFHLFRCFISYSNCKSLRKVLLIYSCLNLLGLLYISYFYRSVDPKSQVAPTRIFLDVYHFRPIYSDSFFYVLSSK